MFVRICRLAGMLALLLGSCSALAHSAEDPTGWKPAAIMPPAWPEEIRARNAEMKRRVDQWLAEGTQSQSPIYVVYLTCDDQEPFAGHRERINRVLSEIQEWFAVQHEAAGFGRTTLVLERDEQQRVKLHEGKLPFTVESRSRENIRETHRACNAAAKEVLAKAGVDYDRNFVLVLTTIPDDHGAAPFFGVIIQDRGYCFAVDTAWLDCNYTQTDGPVVWKGKRIGAANSALIGGMAHELGHGLGLPHSDEPAAYRPFGESLMASGNYTWREELSGRSRGSFLLDTDAMLLIARPPFTGRMRGYEKQPQASVDDMQLTQQDGGTLIVTGRIQSDIPVHAVKIFDDPPENSDYNAVAHAALPDEATGEFRINFEPLMAVGEHQLRVLLFHVNGRWTQFRSTMTIAAEGKVDLSQAQRELGKK